MARKFRRWDVEQRWLLPPSVQELVPDDHPAHFVRDLVRNDLELGAIVDCYAEERGQPPFHPVMMTALLLYAYTQGRGRVSRRPFPADDRSFGSTPELYSQTTR